MTLVAGTMVTDRIRLERLLGEGGMGAVWVAEHLTLGTRVAVKFMAMELSAKHPELKERFLREAAAAAKIASPHVVRTFDFGAMKDGTPFLVMELLEGESLSDRLQRQGALPPGEVALIISQVAKALSEAHRLGVVHRDIKPGNIFLMQTGRELFAKVLDFGIAKDTESAVGNATKTGFALGTPQYMSPEQLMSAKAVDAQADLWALTVTAYELLTGSPPFVGETVPHLILSIHSRQFEAPSSVRRPPVVIDSLALDAFFARAFGADKSQRFATALDLADALAVACGVSREGPASSVLVPAAKTAAPDASLYRPPSSQVLAPNTSFTGESAARISFAPRRRNTALVAAVAGTILAGAGIAGFIALRAQSKPQPAEAASTDPTSAETAEAQPSVAPDATPGPAPRPSIALTSPPSTNRVISVPEGLSAAAGNAWIPAFTARSTNTPVASLPLAFSTCRAQEKVLCSESQWAAACAADPTLAGSAAWTATAEGNQGVIRGGASCNDRKLLASGTPNVVAVCCDPAVAVIADGEDIQRLTSARLTDYEVVMNARRADKLASEFYAANVNFLNKERDKDELQKLAAGYFKSNPDAAQVYDTCKITLVSGEWRADCSTILFHGGVVFGLTQKLAFNRGPNKLLRVGEENVAKVP